MVAHRELAAAVLAAACLAAALLTAAPARAVEGGAPPAPCPAIVLYFARGSGQPLVDSERGLAQPGIQLREGLSARYGAANVGSMSDAYTAVGLTEQTLFGPIPNVKLPAEYAPSVADGIREADQNVADLIALCPASWLVLGGYSQGAQVMRGAIAKLDAQEQQRVAAVVLFGDPLFSAGEPNVEAFSNFDRTESGLLRGFLGRLLGFELSPVGPEYAGKVLSWCHARDMVCQGVGLQNGWTTHKTYATDIGEAVEQVSRRLRAAGLTPSATAPRATVGQYRHTVGGTCIRGGCALAEWSGPGTSGFRALGAVTEGQAVEVVCQLHGQRVTGANGRSSAIWDRLATGAFVSDFYLDTQNVGRFSPPIPRCPVQQAGAP